MLINESVVIVVLQALQIFGKFILKVIIDPVFTATFLAILVLLFSCVYSVRTSALHNMHNADTNFLINIKDRDKAGARIWLYASYSWRYLASKNCIIARNWLYSICFIGVALMISLIYNYLLDNKYKGLYIKIPEDLYVIFIIFALLPFLNVTLIT